METKTETKPQQTWTWMLTKLALALGGIYLFCYVALSIFPPALIIGAVILVVLPKFLGGK